MPVFGEAASKSFHTDISAEEETEKDSWTSDFAASQCLLRNGDKIKSISQIDEKVDEELENEDKLTFQWNFLN